MHSTAADGPICPPLAEWPTCRPESPPHLAPGVPLGLQRPLVLLSNGSHYLPGRPGQHRHHLARGLRSPRCAVVQQVLGLQRSAAGQQRGEQAKQVGCGDGSWGAWTLAPGGLRWQEQAGLQWSVLLGGTLGMLGLAQRSL